MPLPLFPSMVAFVPGASELASVAKALGQAYKATLPAWFSVGRKFGPISFEISARRENVCRRVVTGTREVPETVVPATTIPAHVEEIFEWECPESLLAEATQ